MFSKPLFGVDHAALLALVLEKADMNQAAISTGAFGLMWRQQADKVDEAYVKFQQGYSTKTLRATLQANRAAISLRGGFPSIKWNGAVDDAVEAAGVPAGGTESSVRISDSEAHGTDGGWLMEVTLDHIGPTLDRTSAPLPTLPLCQLCPFAATKTSQTEVRVAHATDFQQNRAWGLLWKHSQLLSRGSDTLAVLPALRSGSRRPRSSPATPSASPCGARCARLRRRSRTGAAQREIFSRIETSRGNTHSSCLAAPIH